MLREPGQPLTERCRPALVALDFDGTLTDVDAHAPGFHAAEGEELGRRLGWDDRTRLREWGRALDDVRALPPHTAWVSRGHGVCPANTDPYLIGNTATRRVLEALHTEWTDAALEDAVLEVHHAAYRRVAPTARPEASGVVDALLAAGVRVAVVTNSSTRIVERLLDGFGCRGRDQLLVRGDARKFIVCDSTEPDPLFSAMPDTVEWPGVGRPVQLRRGGYHEALRRLWRETGATPGTTLVVGDNVELDLAMPSMLGAHVHLVLRAGTLAHERALADRLPRGAVSEGLGVVLDRVHG
jgi:FMN phosphatase YigB (HAD superfamily)